MAELPTQQSKSDSHLPSYMQDQYPPPSSQSLEGIPYPSGTGSYAKTKGMDRFLAMILTFIGVVVVFALLVVSLKSISSTHNVMDITPDRNQPVVAPGAAEEPVSDIVGDR